MSLNGFRTEREALVGPGGHEVHVRDMTATFSAELALEQAQGVLGEVGQWLPVDGDAGRGLGELVSVNSTGPLRLGYGGWRDLLLGCQFLNGRGELITAGGRTVKNVAGYDLTKFMVGQGGVFGKPVTITTRTYLKPAAALLAIFEPRKVRINDLLATPCRPQWCARTPGSLLCGYLGEQRTIDYYVEAVKAFGPQEINRISVEQDGAHRRELWQLAGKTGTFRAAVPPVVIERFAQEAGLDDWVADAAFGIVIGETEQKEKLRAAATSVGGSVYFYEEGKVVCEMEAAVRPLMERLKAAFDPEGKLTPLPVP